MKSIIDLLLKSFQLLRKPLICKSFPTRIWIEPTNFCNLKCVMCPQKDIENDKKGFMDLNLFKKIIDEAKIYGPSINLFLGGEPFAHPEIIEMIRYVKRNGLVARIETNAGLLDIEKSKAVINEKVDFINFSFDGYTKEIYEKIRVNGNFEKTLQNIINFLKIKKTLNSKRPFTSFQIIQLPDLVQVDEHIKKDFLKQLSGLPINQFRIQIPHRFGGKIEENVTGNTYAYTNEKKHLKYQPCPYPWTSMGILWNGTVVPCCLDFFGDYTPGNLTNNSISEIWNNEKYINIRSKLIEKNFKDIKLCSQCDFLFQESFMGISKVSIKHFIQFLRETLYF